MRRVFAPSIMAARGLRCFAVLPELIKPKGQPATLPALPFDAAKGCPPVFSPRQIELHYQRHHKAYVDKFNALAKENFDGLLIEEVMKKTVNYHADRVLFNQSAQHFNHSFFWKCLVPQGKPMPDNLKKKIEEAFGSVDAFKQKFEESGMSNFGSGWTWLVYSPPCKRLKIVNTSNAASPLCDDFRPVFTVDVWEHAYYKDFEFRRVEYLAEIWKIVNWEFVDKQLARSIAE